MLTEENARESSRKIAPSRDDGGCRVVLDGPPDAALGRLGQAFEHASLDVVGIELGDRRLFLIIGARRVGKTARQRRKNDPVVTAVLDENPDGSLAMIMNAPESLNPDSEAALRRLVARVNEAALIASAAAT